MKFSLVRKLGEPKIDKEKEDEKMEEEHNLFNMPQQQNEDQDIPVEDKVIDVNSDVVNVNDTSENQDNNENQNENERNENMGEVIENTNWENEEKQDQELKDRMIRMQNFPSMSNQQDKEKSEKELENVEWQFSDVSVIPRNNKPYKYTLTLNISQLAELINNQKIIYDSSIQRGERITAKGEKKPLIFNSNVKTILSKMLDGSMDAGTVLLNYAKEYPNNLVFNLNERTLSGKGALAIVDSAHRLEAVKIWDRKYRKKPDTIKNPNDFYFPVIVFNLTHDEAKNLFVEANSRGRVISKTRIAFHDVFNPSRSIAERLEKESQLRGKVESISSTIKKTSTAIITYKTLLDGASVFKVATNKEAENISNFLIDYWNELINLFPLAMGNVEPSIKLEQKEKSYVIENLFINAYFTLAKALMNDPDWKNKLHRLTENDFLSRSNPLWQKIQIDGKIVNRSSTSKFVQESLIDYVVNGKSIEELMSEK